MKKDSVMKKLFKYIGKYWILLILSIILAGISVVLQLYVPVLFGNAIDEIVAAHNVNFTQMWLYLKQILLFVVIAAAAIWIMNLVNNRMTYHIVQDIRSQAIRHIQKLPLSYLDQHSTGDIVTYHCCTDILSDGLLLGFTQLFSRRCDRCCNLDLHVFQERVDHFDGHPSDTTQLPGGKIYFLTLFYHV